MSQPEDLTPPSGGHLSPTLLASFQRLFETLPVRQHGPRVAGKGDFMASMQQLRRRLAEQHNDSMARSAAALAGSLDALRRPVIGVSNPQPAFGVAPASPVRGSVETLSEAQWLLYFAAELSARSPHVSERRAFRMATRLHAMAPHVTPEYAAVAMLAGLDPAVLQ